MGDNHSLDYYHQNKYFSSVKKDEKTGKILILNAKGETFMPSLLGLADVYNMHSAAEKVDYKTLIKGYEVIRNTFEEFNN